MPGQVYELRFDLFAVSARIRQGHALRVAIAGWDRDTFPDWVRSRVPEGLKYTVEHNAHYPSRIVLPIRDLAER